MRQEAPYRLPKLPPKREKVETIEILRSANKAALAIAELKGIAQTIPNQTMLINAVVLQEAKDSSEIENIITSTDELYEALSSNKSQTNSEIKEVVNYRRSIFIGYEIVKKQGFLRVNDIIKIQQDLIENNAGIRSTPGTVLKNDQTGEVVYTPPQDKAQIEELLTNFINHFNETDAELSPLINLAILHYQFESIHPFYDGNGRTGRILNILYLILNDLLEIPILYLSSYIIKNKGEYYTRLNAVNKNDEWENWILYILKAVEVTSKQTIAQIQSIRELLKLTIKNVRENAPKIYSKELVENIFEQPYTKIEYITTKLGVERKAASRYLRKFKEIGILESKKVGKEVIYINKELIKLLKQSH
jgi:Fic family protein